MTFGIHFVADQDAEIYFGNLPLSIFLSLFSGTLVHGLYRYLKSGRSAESLLAGGSLSGQLYFSLLDAVINCSFKANPSSFTTGTRGRDGGRGRRRRRRGGRGSRGGGQVASEEINNRFALLMSEEDYVDDW